VPALADLGANWDGVAANLAEIDVVFESEREAVARITRAIGDGLDLDLGRNPDVEAAVEAAVARTYRDALRTFADNVAGTDLADALRTEADVRLTASLDRFDDRLAGLERRLTRYDDASLRNEGFVRLDPLYFERHRPGDPATAWRTGFTLAEVAAGYPLDRQRPRHGEADRRPVVEEVTDRLARGEPLVVLGERGAGKSTVCKAAACAWHAADRGPVFYRASTTTTAFDEPGELLRALRAADGTPLVVVEDCTDDRATAVYEVVDEFGRDAGAAFLLDALESEWENAPALLGDARLDTLRRSLHVVTLPALDRVECRRAVDHFEAVTGTTTVQTGDQLFGAIRDADVGGPLLLAYQLTGPPTDDDTVSAFRTDVETAYADFHGWADGDRLRQAVGVLVNVLNAADLPVDGAYVHALATDHDDHVEVDRALARLEGTTLVAPDEADAYRVPHRLWSLLYLQIHLERAASRRVATRQFERCVNALFRLLDDPDRRRAVAEYFGRTPAALEQVEDAPREVAVTVVEAVFDIGRQRAKLAPLLGSTRYSGLELPATCPSETSLRCTNWRGSTWLLAGDFERATEEFDLLRERAGDADELDASETARLVGRALNNRGIVARKRGNLDEATEYHRRSLELFRDHDDRRGQALCFDSLGVVARHRDRYERAADYHRRSIELNRELDDRFGEARSIEALGVVARDRGDLAEAERCFRRSLRLKRELGDRHGEAMSLNDLGLTAYERGEFDVAEEYVRRSLTLKRELGDRLGEAMSLGTLGHVAWQRGDLADATDWLRRSLAVNRDRGDQHGVVLCLAALADVARDRDDPSAARRALAEAVDTYRDIDRAPAAVSALVELVELCEAQDDAAAALEHCERALELSDRHGLDDHRATLESTRDRLAE
jgi:tetratricopeptide (TPR) repeat protein